MERYIIFAKIEWDHHPSEIRIALEAKLFYELHAPVVRLIPGCGIEEPQHGKRVGFEVEEFRRLSCLLHPHRVCSAVSELRDDAARLF